MKMYDFVWKNFRDGEPVELPEGIILLDHAHSGNLHTIWYLKPREDGS